MNALENYKIQLRNEEHFYTNKEPFSAADGFMVAAALSGYKGGAPEPIPAEYGAMKFYRKQWTEEGWSDFSEIK